MGGSDWVASIYHRAVYVLVGDVSFGSSGSLRFALTNILVCACNQNAAATAQGPSHAYSHFRDSLSSAAAVEHELCGRFNFADIWHVLLDICRIAMKDPFGFRLIPY